MKIPTPPHSHSKQIDRNCSDNPTIPTPITLYGELFSNVQTERVFPDSKTFADARPKHPANTIINNYHKNSQKSDFNLKLFVLDHFEIPTEFSSKPDSKQLTIREKIAYLWLELQREKNLDDGSSRIPLPYKYVVPGGRFREIYYWDSYFTMLGLAESGHVDMVEDMVKNFAYLLDTVGLIPNGNRSYYCSRSQPPFFALMVELLAKIKQQESIFSHYLPQLQIEYNFWMHGAERLTTNGQGYRRVVRLNDVLLNRHWDNNPQPREESYREDTELAATTQRDKGGFYRDVRAACETGWDFSSRWLSDPNDITSIRTSQIIPIDLNSLLYKTECILAKAYLLSGQPSQHANYRTASDKRKQAIQQFFYNPKQKLFTDLLLADGKYSPMSSVATAYPLFFNIATTQQALGVASSLERTFLKPGGWVTTPIHSSQQWDAPNGWAPLQWIVYKGLNNYGFEHLAKTGAHHWVENNRTVYHQTGYFLEKYNVETIGAAVGGGEYTLQYGFGWSNAVLLKLMNELNIDL